MQNEISARLARMEASHLALRLIVAILIDQLTEGMADAARTAAIARLFNGAQDAIDAAGADGDGNPGEWLLAQARREVNEIAGRLLQMGV